MYTVHLKPVQKQPVLPWKNLCTRYIGKMTARKIKRRSCETKGVALIYPTITAISGINYVTKIVWRLLSLKLFIIFCSAPPKLGGLQRLHPMYLHYKRPINRSPQSQNKLCLAVHVDLRNPRENSQCYLRGVYFIVGVVYLRVWQIVLKRFIANLCSIISAFWLSRQTLENPPHGAILPSNTAAKCI